MANKFKKIIVEIARILLGCTFVFSGFVKAVDPLGGAYKFHDYFAAWGIDWLDFLSLPASFGLSALEFTLGICLLLGVYRIIVSWFILAFMAFMTLLALYLAIYNPVTDCGCFGDALVITNWQTFYKNLILIALAIIVFVWNKKITRFVPKKIQKWATTCIILFILGVSYYCYTHLPILDFRPYKIGNNIRELMEIPDDAEQDVYETALIYEKNGVQQKFSLTDYPKNDTAWKFVETINTLIKKGYEPPIHDFTITTENGDEITDVVLNDTSCTFLLIAHKLEKANDSHIDKINNIYDWANDNNYRFLCLTASTADEIEAWRTSTGAEYPFCITDDVTLKTIIRSNPGLVLIKDAVVIDKWPNSCLPMEKEINSLK
ncbi:MAG: DoxX family protein [Candidatus Symbiothrix sp.]|jgi:uncharacterized membrane protein YphA (DoxX/SURF4 family)|nr:DoxX family protein [Candidatus Symbiothrix sp.]